MANDTFNFRLRQFTVDRIIDIMNAYQPGDFLRVHVKPEGPDFILVRPGGPKSYEWQNWFGGFVDPDWCYNEFTQRDEDGRWWLIGLPGGPRPLLGPDREE